MLSMWATYRIRKYATFCVKRVYKRYKMKRIRDRPWVLLSHMDMHQDVSQLCAATQHGSEVTYGVTRVTLSSQIAVVSRSKD